MGFEPEVREIATKFFMPGKDSRHTFMCSATIPKKVINLADDFMKQPILVTIGYLGKTPAEIKQELQQKSEEEKLPFLKEILDTHGNTQVLIFVETKKKCDWLHTFLVGKGIKCAAIHGDKVQSDRIKYLNSFKNKEITILIATDVVARGLDIPGVGLVINMDMPKNIED